MLQTVSVFGIPIEGWGWEKIREHFLSSSIPCWIVTANPEILLFAAQYASYRETLCKASLRIVDGFGLWILLKLFREDTFRLTGVELAECLLFEAEKQNWRVAFIGGRHDVVEQAANFWKSKMPRLQIHAESGGKIADHGEEDLRSTESRQRLVKFDPQVVFVAFGHPKQEMWIAKHKQDFLNLRVIVGVGGTFSYWAGMSARSPQWMRSLGLEWLYRLTNEPWRFRRVLRAVVVFPYYFILGKNCWDKRV